MQTWLKFGLGVALLVPRLATAKDYVTGYAVGNHRVCSLSNLPGTIPELQKFFASPHLPVALGKNVLWTDARVRVNEWQVQGDAFASKDTASGRDGADAALISYIATHGSTSGGVYTAYAGGDRGFGGCGIKTTELALGDQELRYLFLSTCQGLKIGTGEDPSATGEDPITTWRGANRGLNCIFGYSNNMADADTYGADLLQLVTNSQLTLTQAFFRASRQVSYANIPAVLCYGKDDQAAEMQLNEGREFVAAPLGGSGAAYAWEKPNAAAKAFLPKTQSAAWQRGIMLAPRLPDLQRLSSGLLGKSWQQVEKSRAQMLRQSPQGVLSVDQQRGAIIWQSKKVESKAPFTMPDAAVVKIAQGFAVRHGLFAGRDDWQTSYVIEHGVGVRGGRRLAAKTVVFHQGYAGLYNLGVRGSAEVRIDAEGVVVGLMYNALDLQPSPGLGQVQLGSVDSSALERQALARRLAEDPNAAHKLVERRFGYASGSYASAESLARAVLELTWETSRGGVARRFIEVVPL